MYNIRDMKIPASIFFNNYRSHPLPVPRVSHVYVEAGMINWLLCKKNCFG